MMADKEYIDREALLEWVREFYPNDKQFISAVINAPKAAVQEIKHSGWKFEKDICGCAWFTCQNCHKYIIMVKHRLYPYCPFCGAKMNKE